MGKAFEQKLAENEVIIRKANRYISQRFAELKEMAQEDNQIDTIPGIDDPIYFYCECADEKCHERISMKPSQYARIHKDSKHFTIRPGHDVPEIEEIVQANGQYIVVRKFKKPPEKTDTLNKTGLHNV